MGKVSGCRLQKMSSGAQESTSTAGGVTRIDASILSGHDATAHSAGIIWKAAADVQVVRGSVGCEKFFKEIWENILAINTGVKIKRLDLELACSFFAQHLLASLKGM
ncbi:hypothetical protein Q7C36_000509 [Tachysurus vachellii]|uniref:Uncharacterized protein n=1 Tax=Tachysurus vachellii TaxID=175792 RepID=A0AA88T962_TACVA|nr:hypothetical protein Q7C36_000509 [Tachysurus vachellii]